MSFGWETRHDLAMKAPSRHEPGERLIVNLMRTMKTLVDSFRANIGALHDDSVLGPGIFYLRDAVEAVGNSVLILLNGDIGPRLDPGTIDSMVRAHVRAVGLDGDSF